MRKYFIIIPILILVYFLSDKDNSSIKTENKRIETDNLIVNMSNYGLENILLSEYLNGVIACEMPALFHDEAIKAGIVAARTFIYINMKVIMIINLVMGTNVFLVKVKEKKIGEIIMNYIMKNIK